MLVSPTQITMNSSLNINSTTDPACVINNPTVANSNISFRNGANFWTTGMRSGNFVIASNYITTNRAGGNIQNDVAIQINQNGFLNIPHDMNLWGVYTPNTIYGTREQRLLEEIYAYNQQWKVNRLVF